MKTAIIAGCAALFLATGAAHARDQLPDVMIGQWCWKQGGDDERRTIYTRGTDCEESTLALRQDGYEEIWDSCIFADVKRTYPYIYEVRATCGTLKEGDLGFNENIPPWTELLEYQIIDGNLVVTNLAEG